MIKKHVFALSLAIFTAGAVLIGSASGVEARTKSMTKCWSGCKISYVDQQKKKKKSSVSKRKKTTIASHTVSKKKVVAKKPSKRKSVKTVAAVKPKKIRTSRPVAMSTHKFNTSNTLGVADNYVGLSERGHKRQLMGLFSFAFDGKIDPARTPWCAAFVNSVLRKTGKKGTGSLAAASFRSWGKSTRNPKAGDIVVMRGHVGFYVGTTYKNGQRYVAVLGGNQSNKVKVTYYRASKVVAYRTAA